jgi:hypothetical protein
MEIKGGLWCSTPLSTIVAVSFIGGGNRGTRRKTSNCKDSTMAKEKVQKDK